MTDAYKKARDEAARKHVQETLHVTDDYFFSHGGEEMSWFKAGADWAMAYERERSKKLVEALDTVIEDHPEKCTCWLHEVLKEYEAAHE